MNEAQRRLKDYQQKAFISRPIGGRYDGFDLRAYPETAMKVDLDYIGIAIRITPRMKKESCEDFRKRVLLALATPDKEAA